MYKNIDIDEVMERYGFVACRVIPGGDYLFSERLAADEFLDVGTVLTRCAASVKPEIRDKFYADCTVAMANKE